MSTVAEEVFAADARRRAVCGNVCNIILTSLGIRHLMIMPCTVITFCLTASLLVVAYSKDTSGHEMHNALESYQIQNVRHSLDGDIQLGSSHACVQNSGQWVDVNWKGVQDPQDDDFIALYAPANVSIHETSPVKYQWAVKASSHRHEGAGTIRCASADCPRASDLFPRAQVDSHIARPPSPAVFVGFAC